MRTELNNETGQPGEDLGSRNFNWSTPLVGLKGRAGLDLALSLVYNSLVWTKEGSTMRFNADHGYPGPGFRLGFPTLQQQYYDSQSGAYAYLMITPSGSRVELRQVSSGSSVYESANNNHTQLTIAGSSFVVRTADGTQYTFSPSVNGEMECTQIKDRNGNYITASYNNLGRLTSITDTLGRVVNFNYDTQNYLISITQSCNGAAHTWASFSYGNLYVQTNFPGFAIQGPNNTNIPVLIKVGLADGTSYGFDYTSWGQVHKITHFASDGHEWAHTRYNLPLTATPMDSSTAQSDCPRFTQRYDYAEYWNNGAEATTNYSVDPGGTWRQHERRLSDEPASI